MTLNELSQLYYLNREIESDQQRLKELEQLSGSPSSPQLTGMPHSGSTESKVEKIAAEIVDLRDLIKTKQRRCLEERVRLERWINTIPDSLTRQVFQYRFAECLNWKQVVFRVGGPNTTASVKMICYRYLKERNKAEKK